MKTLSKENKEKQKKKLVLDESAKNFLEETKQIIRKNNIKWYLTHSGWWNTEVGKQLKEHWGIEDVEELKGK